MKFFLFATFSASLIACAHPEQCQNISEVYSYREPTTPEQSTSSVDEEVPLAKRCTLIYGASDCASRSIVARSMAACERSAVRACAQLISSGGKDLYEDFAVYSCQSLSNKNYNRSLIWCDNQSAKIVNRSATSESIHRVAYEEIK